MHHDRSLTNVSTPMISLEPWKNPEHLPSMKLWLSLYIVFLSHMDFNNTHISKTSKWLYIHALGCLFKRSLDLKESWWREYWCSNDLIYANWWILSIGNWFTLRHAFVAVLVMHWWGVLPPRRSPALRQIKFIRPSVFSRLPSIRIIVSTLTPNRPVPAWPWSLPRTSLDGLKL